MVVSVNKKYYYVIMVYLFVHLIAVKSMEKIKIFIVKIFIYTSDDFRQGVVQVELA